MTTPYYTHYVKAVENPLPELKNTFQLESDLLAKYVREKTSLYGLVADLGCGVGRPVIELSESYLSRTFFGIDNDPDMIRIAKSRVVPPKLPMVVPNLHFYQENFLETTLPDDCMDLTYSTYNSIGHLTDIEKELLIKEKSRITKPEGHVITLTWKRDEATTKFLREYYPHIGLRVIYSTDCGTVTDNGSFDRVDLRHIFELYEKFDIELVDAENIGLWAAVIGQKVKK